MKFAILLPCCAIALAATTLPAAEEATHTAAPANAPVWRPPELPAFPGAEGFGAVSRGGRGGKVIKVTNLNAEGPGSLQAACDAEGPRIVVFTVSGVIRPGGRSKKPGIMVKHPQIYIAGQTAPGAGITVEGKISAAGSRTDPARRLSDITLRFLRARPKYMPTADGGYVTGGRAIEVEYTDRAIVDHCSASWAVDEEFLFFGTTEATAQWCAIEGSDVSWEGGDEPHNFGMLMGYKADAVFSLHHTLFAHHHDRAPLFKRDTRVLDVRNNVLYNFGTGTGTHAGNLVGNYLKDGPGAIWGYPRIYHPVATITCPTAQPAKGGQVHVAGNYHAWMGGYCEVGQGTAAALLDAPPVTTHLAEEAYDQVLAEVGCLPRDAVGRRTIYEVVTRTGQWGRQEPPGGLMEGLTATQAPPDADEDGMPDDWEKACGLDPNDPADAVKIVPAGASRGDRHKGYTYIEYYVNELADIKIAEALTAARLVPGPGENPPKPNFVEPPKPVAEMVADITVQNKSTAKTDTTKAFYAIQSLSRMDPKIAAAAVPALVADLAKAVETTDNRKACFAAWAIGAMGREARAAVPGLVNALEHEFPVGNGKWTFDPHGFIAWALGRIGPEAREAVPILTKALGGKDLWARRPAAWALAQIGADAKSSVTELVAALKGASGGAWNARDNTQFHAAEALARIGEPALGEVTKALSASDARIRRGAARTTGMMGPASRDATAALLKALSDGEPLVKSEAALALAAVAPGDKAVMDGLAGLLADADYGVRVNAAQALEKAGTAAAAAVPALKKALGDKQREVRYAAARALGKIGLPAVPALVEVLSGKDDGWLRSRCAQALGYAGAGEGAARATQALLGALGDKEALVRREAIWALGRLGPSAGGTKGAIEKAAAGDQDYMVSHAAKQVIQKLAGQ